MAPSDDVTTEPGAAALGDSAPRPIGASLRSGPLAFGTWRYAERDPAAGARLIRHAVERGLNLLDTADIYGFDGSPGSFGRVEGLLGEVFRADPTLRDELVLATKGGISPGVPYDSSPHYLRRACHASLRRLGVEVIDCYQVHRPDLFADPEAVAHAVEGLVADGVVRCVGVSNYTVAQHEAIVAALGPGVLATSQPEYSALHLSPLRDGTLDRCRREGVTPLLWSPLAGGRLATQRCGNPALDAVLDDLAEREGTPRAAIALAFVLAHPSRPVAIVGTQRVDRIDEACRALEVRLDRRDAYRIVEASEGVPLP